jgi:helicase required for RNAi-mediated heterochromatin assembly 1
MSPKLCIVKANLLANDDDDSGELNADLVERFKGPRPKFQPIFIPQSDSFDISLNKDIRKYVQEQEKKVKDAPPGDWRGRSELPTADEISLAADDEVVLPPNKVRGKWKTTDKYLRTHYELHREDAVSPLRDAVDRFRKDPSMHDDFNISIYDKVYICGFTFSQLGLAARVHFCTSRAGRQIPWQSSKRLVSGTLVALSPADNKFESKCVVAIVAARPLSGLEVTPPEIDLFFSRPQDIHIDPQQAWIMVEAKQGYYEAYRHTLKALQKLSHETFPLSSHIVSISPDIQTPDYVKEEPIMNLAPATAEGQLTSYEKADILNHWPTESLSTLDKSQWSALNQILTRSLAMVQGPPGTGKTYVSKVALELLHGHLKEDDPPIIITAQTNHALDQLLLHVSKFEPNFIRLGGRSTNLDVKKRALYEVRSKERLPLIPGGLLGTSTRTWTEQSKKMVALLEPLREEPGKPFALKSFAQHGIISQDQSASLEKAAARWINADGMKTDPLELWLDRALIPFKVDYHIDHFGVIEDDEDLEFEQLREQEAEHGVNDEEDAELLKGLWCVVRHDCTVHDPMEKDLEKAVELLNTQPDLWKVPEYLRGPMYKIMGQCLIQKLQDKIRELAAGYNKNLNDLRVGKWERDAVFLKRAKIIGLTTTGLSKYRPLIASLNPKIVLIEEAAEVLEAPVTVACMQSVQHLILVGDHQQLQGHCSVRDLEGEPYHLNVSLFERLVRNRIPYKNLLQQRRMDPSFRELIQSLYPNLADHNSVQDRPSIDWGMGNINSFFFSHEWHEHKDNQMSTYNQEEAKFIAGFMRYLVRNAVPPSQVTILTFYNGQRKRLLKEIRAFPELKESYQNVKTVDSYQGEENDIVLLSLTRNNYEGKIGFLEISNRVCVALSRAKLGFYIFGNSRLLEGASELWANVVRTMETSDRLGMQQFPIFCKKHQVTTIVGYPDEWLNHDGGCDIMCDKYLDCGHKCSNRCHPYPHSKIYCTHKCERELGCGHPCQVVCGGVCHCNCPEFAEIERQTWKPPVGDIRQTDGAGSDEQITRKEIPMGSYVSGQKAHDSVLISDLYLPAQDPELIDLEQTLTVDRSQPGKQVLSSSNSTRLGSSNEALAHSDQSPTKHRNAPNAAGSSRFSPEKQHSSKMGWETFATGGVIHDDERRAVWSENERLQPAASKDWPTLGQAKKIEEKTQVLGGGRKKFTHGHSPNKNG